jgi:hypothetical protein
VSVLDLYTETEALLAAAIEALDEIPTFSPGLGGAPERSFVVMGTPALDCCDQLTVQSMPLTEAPTEPLNLGAGTRHKQDFRKNYVGWRITTTRCADMSSMNNNQPLSVEAQQAVAEQCYADAWALWNYLWNMARAGEIFSICNGVYFDSLNPLTPSGGCYGSVLTIRAELAGFEGTPS